MKRFLTLITAASLLLASNAMPIYGATTFVDINKVPWPGAATFINQAADLGLMSGYNEDGKKYCKPRNPVTYCEATQLMYSIMKTYYKEDVPADTIEKWKPIMVAYHIPSWAYSAVAFSLEKGLVVTSELSKFMNGNTQKNASREDVGVLFGKALGKIYSVDMDAKLKYADVASISKTAVPYLDLLYDHKIMVGDDYNKFNPKQTINRSEMAVLSVKTYNKLMGEGATAPTDPNNLKQKGTIVTSFVSVNGDMNCVLQTSDGNKTSLTGKPSEVKVYEDGKTIAFTELKAGDQVEVTYKGSTLKSITRMPEKFIDKGSFVLKDVYGMKLTVEDGSQKVNYTMSDNVRVSINDTTSSPAKLYSAYKDGTDFMVQLYVNDAGEVNKVLANEIKDGPKTGQITDLTSKSIEIKADGKHYTYKLDKDVKIKDTLTDYDLDDLIKKYDDLDMFVTLTTDKTGIVTTITLNYSENEEQGILTDMNSRRLTITSKNKEYTYMYDSEARVTVDGKKQDMKYLRDHYEDTSYRVALTINRYDEVTEVVAIEESMGASSGIILYLSQDEIEIEDKDRQKHTYSLMGERDLEVIVNDRKTELEDLRHDYRNYDYEVKLTFKNKKVSKIEAVNTEADEGLLRSIDKSEISIQMDGDSFTYDLDSDVEVRGDVNRLDTLIDEFRHFENFYVELKFNSSHSKVVEINAKYDKGEDQISGRLTYITRSRVEVDRKNEYDFARNVRVYINDRSSEVRDLMDAFEDGDRFDVRLYLDRDKQVTKVEATKR